MTKSWEIDLTNSIFMTSSIVYILQWKVEKYKKLNFWSNIEKNETFLNIFIHSVLVWKWWWRKKKCIIKSLTNSRTSLFFLSFQLSNCTEERKRNFFPCTYFLGQQKDWERIKMQNTYLFHRKFITTNKVNSGGQTLKLSRLLCCTVSKKFEKSDI